MDLIFAIIATSILFAIHYKANRSSSRTVASKVLLDTGEEVDTVVSETSLVVGNNLMLRREPQAYHKILIELGLI